MRTAGSDAFPTVRPAPRCVCRMFRQQFTKLDAFGIQDCGLTGDSCGQPLFSHKPSYWYKSEFPLCPPPPRCMYHVAALCRDGKRYAHTQPVHSAVCLSQACPRCSTFSFPPSLHVSRAEQSGDPRIALALFSSHRHRSHVLRHQGQHAPPDVNCMIIMLRLVILRMIDEAGRSDPGNQELGPEETEIGAGGQV